MSDGCAGTKYGRRWDQLGEQDGLKESRLPGGGTFGAAVGIVNRA